jgi:hypothetical protein
MWRQAEWKLHDETSYMLGLPRPLWCQNHQWIAERTISRVAVVAADLSNAAKQQCFGFFA